MTYPWIRNLFQVENSSLIAWAAKLGLQLQNLVRSPSFPPVFSLVFTLVFSSVAQAIPTPAGTVISNTANSSQQVGAAAQTASTNAVTVTVGGIVAAGTPTLTKAFGAASINAGTSTPLVFTLTNVAGNPVQAAMAFTDTLPASLQLNAGATGTVSGAGCSGTVNLVAPGTIAVSALAMTAGTATCAITINAVTNLAGTSNDTCTGTPAAFTNGSGNIGGLVGITNAVTNQCLVVKVLIIDSLVAKCINDTPYVDYTVHAVGVPTPPGVSIDWQKIGGGSAQILPNQPLTGRLLWPGAAVDASGNPTAWPGWQFTGGQWVQINDGLRPDMNIAFTINPTTTALVSYPPATPTCNANPPQVPAPTLTKAFAQNVIVDGESTSVVFTITSAAGQLGRSGIAFTDMLPAGLAVNSSAGGVISAGCNGNISFQAPNVIMVSNFMIAQNVASCTLTVSGITNRNGALNATQCGSVNDPAFTNDAAAMGNLTNITSGITPQCLRVLPPMPTLTKQFAAARIIDGDSTKLYLIVNNSSAAPVVSGLAFTDTLPAGLMLSAGAAYAIVGGACTGQITLTAPAQISVSNFSFPAGVHSCAVVVDGVTNVAGQLNASCASLPAAFTNNAASISGISGVFNGVQPACLGVDAQDPALKSVTVVKTISANSGASPSSPYTVKLSVKNISAAATAVKQNLSVIDQLPAGMVYVPGSLKLTSGSSVISLANSGGTFLLGTRNGVYDTTGNKITVSISTFMPSEQADISFDVAIAGGLALNSVLQNTAQFSYTDSQLNPIGPKNSNTVDFKITDTSGVTLRGQTIASVDPGSTVTFENLLTNTGSKTDTFDITLSGSTFPAGTIIRVFQSDGVTLLADSNGNGVADTGPVPAGGTYKIIVTATLPLGVAGGPYKVRKSAQSITNPLVRAADDDIVGTVTRTCHVTLEPDNSGRVIAGDSIVYTHTLTNTGVCDEPITFPANLLLNASAGWTAQVFLDNPSAGGQSIVGVLDPTDTPLSSTSNFVLPAGARVLLLVKVTSPASAANGTVNTTELRVNGGATGPLLVRDTTTVSTSTTVNNIIQPYIDPNFQRPTVWATISQDFYLKATVPSCVANPTIIEHRTIIITGPNGEHEELIATETGPGTGVFIVDNIPVRAPPVMTGDHIIEGLPYDTLDVEIIGCSQKITTTVTLVDPNGVVFDSVTNAPVSGALVRLTNVTNGQCSTTLATVTQLLGGKIVPAPNPVTTGADGRFNFPLVSPADYCVLVTPPNGYTWTSAVPASRLPAGRNIIATGPTTGGSYGGAFHVGPETGPVIIDVPVDAGKITGLFVQKTPLRTTVEIGEFNDYAVTIANNTGYALTAADVLATDNLPAGFSYVAGTARIDGKPLADPAGKGGAQLVFNIGHMAKDQQVKLSYRVRIGPGAQQGDGINRIFASYRSGLNAAQFSVSNTATAQVVVNDGVFTNKGFITGKVFADCNKDGIQDEKEVGVPGVRVYLEDGTNTIADAEGKFSFYGVTPRTHVLKIDRSSLPTGVTVRDLIALSSRNLGKGDSQIVDLQNGELHKANFAIQSCTEPVMEEISQRRRNAAALKTEVDGRLQQKLNTDPNIKLNADLRALPASGTVGAAGTVPGVQASPDTTTAAAAGTSGFQTIAPAPVKSPVVDEAKREREETENLLETILPSQNNTIDFMGVKDGDVLAYAQSTIRVKGVSDTVFKLTVNDREIPASRVGKKAVLSGKQLQAWEYIGVDLAAGLNTLTVTQLDQFGNARGSKTIKVTAPGDLAKVVIEYPAALNGGAVADGKTVAKVIVRLTDAYGTPITTRTAVTLLTTLGRWNVEDLNAAEPGVQVFIEGGRAEYPLMPPTDPGQAEITVLAGKVKGEAKLDFLPDLRDMIAAGVIEGVLNLRKLDTKALTPARAQDGFEQEITHLSRSWNDGKLSGQARAAMFLKGKVKGEYLLTLSYDSDKNTRDRLFRDIQPDDFYPIYGDSSVRNFDAQSTGRFYVRIDKKKSYLLYGDYNTSQSSETRKLSNYNRSLTGIKQHFENATVSGNVFASRDSTTQVVDEFRGDGTSGPFTLSNIKGLVNSEKVEILTRDRNQTAVVLSSSVMTRFVDYELEPLTGRLLFKAPVPSLDDKLNPMSIRVTYEVDQGGAEFWVAGADAQVKLNDRLEVGGMVVDDRNPLNKFRMAGINGVVKLAEKSFLIAEVAQTHREQIVDALSSGAKQGNAQRIEYKQQGDKFDASVYAGRAAANFDNPSSNLSAGRTEAGGKLAYRIDEKNRVNAEVLHTEDSVANAKRDGISLAAEHQFANGMRLEAGIRYARDTQAAATAAPGSTAAPLTEVTSIRTRVSGDLPGIKGASAYGEAEMDVQDASRKLLAVGGEYKMGSAGRVYARHEFISSLNGPFALNNQQSQNSTVVGVSTDYMKDGNVFSEYRVRDAISGGDAEAALGLRNTWTLAEGVKLQTGFERVHVLSGAATGSGESTALTFGLEYTANPLWKGSARLEFRNGASSDSVLATVAAASKLSQDWTFLGRNTYSLLRNKGSQTGENLQDRMQLGLAYRQTDSDTFTALGRIEHRTEEDTTQPDIELKRSVELLSLQANWQPVRPFTLATRYAAKWTRENSNGIDSKNNAQLVSGRGIWDIAPRWDLSLNVSTMFGHGAQSKYYGLGLEVGYMVMENLWLSAGYNFFGYRDDDLTTGEYTNKGAFLRLRYKFDEDLFAGHGAKGPADKVAASDNKSDAKSDVKSDSKGGAVN